MVAAPVLWVALEYVRAYVLTGFPWYYLAHSQYRLLYFTQIADFSGSLGPELPDRDGQRLLGRPADPAPLPAEVERVVVGSAGPAAAGPAGRGRARACWGRWLMGRSGSRRPSSGRAPGRAAPVERGPGIQLGPEEVARRRSRPSTSRWSIGRPGRVPGPT